MLILLLEYYMCQGLIFLRKKECCASYLLSKKMQDKFDGKNRMKNVEIYPLV